MTDKLNFNETSDGIQHCTLTENAILDAEKHASIMKEASHNNIISGDTVSEFIKSKSFRLAMVGSTVAWGAAAGIATAFNNPEAAKLLVGAAAVKALSAGASYVWSKTSPTDHSSLSHN